MPLDNDSVNGYFLAWAYNDDVTDLDIICRYARLYSILNHVGKFCLEMQQVTDGFGCPALGARLKVAAEKNECKDEDRRIVVGVAGDDECRRHAVREGRKRPHGDEHVHVRPPVRNGDDCPPVEAVADNDHHRDGDGKLEHWSGEECWNDRDVMRENS